MTLNEDFNSPIPWKGSTKATNDNDPHYANGLENVVDLLRRAGYIIHTNASSWRTTDYNRTHTRESVKMSSENRPNGENHPEESSSNGESPSEIAVSSASIRQIQSTKKVPLDIVTRGASGIVGVLCVVSLLITIISGFDMINPLIALLILIASISFSMMTLMKSGTEPEKDNVPETQR